tara:strand:+ start:618 stop:1073 length:456 start_codon:yes stop_codon:yes gene_type:complete
MDLFTNPIRGMLGNAGASMTAQAHFKRFPARDLRVESYKMFSDMGAEEKLFRRFEDDMRKGLIKEIGNDEAKLLEVTKHVCEEIKHSLRDIVMVGHFQLELLKKILMEDEEIMRKGFPKVKGTELGGKVRQEITDTFDVLRNAGNTLLSTK